MSRRLSRRGALLLGGGAVAALSVGVLGAFAAFGDEDLLRGILRRSVGPFDMGQDDFEAFQAELATGNTREAHSFAYRSTYRAPEMVGLTPMLIAYAPDAVADRYEQFQRRVVTVFLTQTTYLSRDRGKNPVVFLGAGACVNPFANTTPA